MEAEYVATYEAAKKVIWFMTFLINLQVVLSTSHFMSYTVIIIGQLLTQKNQEATEKQSTFRGSIISFRISLSEDR